MDTKKAPISRATDMSFLRNRIAYCYAKKYDLRMLKAFCPKPFALSLMLFALCLMPSAFRL